MLSTKVPYKGDKKKSAKKLPIIVLSYRTNEP